MSDEIPEGLEIWYQHRVSYGETDMMGVVYYAEYFHMFERARNEIIRSTGIPYKRVEEGKLFLPVFEAHCRYRISARYDELLDIHTWVSKWTAASFTIMYEIYDENHTRLLVEGYTKHACVNDKGRPVPVPEWFKEVFFIK